VADKGQLAYNGPMDSYVPRYHRVYLVDDHDIVRRGLRDLLVNSIDIDVVGDCNNVADAVSDILRLETDVMLLDLQMQDGTGVEVCRAVRAVKPEVSGLLLTASGDAEAQAAAVLAGAAGYLVKMNRGGEIVNAIRKLRPHTSLLDEASVERAGKRLRRVVDSLVPPVTEHERRVLDLIIEGQTDGQLAAGLATEVPGADVDVQVLVARVTQTLLGRGPISADLGSSRAPLL